jgi:hypothetical protein
MPGKLKSQYAVNWRPIFKLMEEAPDLNIPMQTDEVEEIARILHQAT